MWERTRSIDVFNCSQAVNEEMKKAARVQACTIVRGNA
jgi:hypothetical protein